MQDPRSLGLEGPGPWGDATRHLPFELLEQGLARHTPPKDEGELALIVSYRTHRTTSFPRPDITALSARNA